MDRSHGPCTLLRSPPELLAIANMSEYGQIIDTSGEQVDGIDMNEDQP